MNRRGYAPVIMLTLKEAEVVEALLENYEHVKTEEKQLIQDVALDCDPLAILASQGINFEADYTREDTPRNPNEPGQDVYRASISFSISDYMFDFDYKLWVSYKATAAYVSVKSGVTINGKPIKAYDGRKLNTLEALYVLLPQAPDLSYVMDVTEELVNLRSDYQKKITT
jgi:hypothetical protein